MVWNRETFAPVIDDSQLRLDSGRTRVFVDDFVEDIIAYVDRRPPVMAFFARYDEGTNILWFHLTGALGWWAAKRRRESRPLLQLQAIKVQLKELTNTYVVNACNIVAGDAERRCFGLKIDVCAREGLDVPTRLQKRESLDIVVDMTTD